MSSTESQKRLRWCCRRGMLELDILLEKYLDDVYSSLNATEQALFAELLDCHDQQLFNWFMGKEAPDNPQFVYLVEQIKNHAKIAYR